MCIKLNLEIKKGFHIVRELIYKTVEEDFTEDHTILSATLLFFISKGIFRGSVRLYELRQWCKG